ncbi:small integral membrane protein 13-like [Xyrauchen texanus]|uniref:small integral membrane protein 13-like n=1 Tax=Xyrauchen texanus TaxID=154827 RepID=UPI0022418D3C|nr:small integral membrane protein 13-like [Xyrauchen texanus]XP_051948837.1 small integral membrane protein 13-like [Xyrauchen texanus]
MWQSVGLTVLVIVATLICVLLFMLFGWYVVWQLFLSKFKFLRELVGDTGSPQTETEPSESECSSPLTPRHRPKTSRQRIIPPDSTT